MLGAQGVLLAIPITGVMMSACASHRPFDPALINHEFYLCCNLRFNQDGDATDANYAYPTAGTTIPYGTRVQVTKIDDWSIEIQPKNDSHTYHLELRFGRAAQTPSQYFQNILRQTNPRETLKGVSPSVNEAVAQGQLIVGMTKDEAIVARGYPPLHRTDSIQADEWVYYHTPGFVDRVRFLGGKIDSVKHGPAPE